MLLNHVCIDRIDVQKCNPVLQLIPFLSKQHSKREGHKSSNKHKGRDHRSREDSTSMSRQSRERSDEPDDDIIGEKKEKKSTERRSPVKVVHSAVKTVDRQSDNDSSTAMSMSEDEADKESDQSFDFHSKSGGQDQSKFVDAPDSAMAARVERLKRPSSREHQPPDNDTVKERYYSPQQEFDSSPPPPTKVQSAARYPSDMYEKQFDREQEYIQVYKQNTR